MAFQLPTLASRAKTFAEELRHHIEAITDLTRDGEVGVKGLKEFQTSLQRLNDIGDLLVLDLREMERHAERIHDLTKALRRIVD